MALQYISDHSGNYTAVVIPINEWYNITAVHQGLKALESVDEIIKNANLQIIKDAFLNNFLSSEVNPKFLVVLISSKTSPFIPSDISTNTFPSLCFI